MSFRQQAREQESTLRQELNRALVADIPADPAETERQLGRLRALADNVKQLRVRAFSEEAYAAAERRAALRERIQEEQEKAEERQAREPGRAALRLLTTFADPELRGLSLRAERLTVEQCADLHELVKARAAGTLSDRKRRQLHKLVGVAADERGLYERVRAERKVEQQRAAEAERARREAMPVRRFEGKGGAYLPGYLYGWLTSGNEGSLTVTDITVLAVVVMAIEHGHSPFARSEFADGAIVIDSATGFAFLPCMNPGGELGDGRVRDAIAYLAGNDWLKVGTLGGRTSVTLGERARKLLEEATGPVT